MNMTRTQQYDSAVKRITDAGGTWPPSRTMAKMAPRWPGAGRYERVPCRGCGAACAPSRRWCEDCGEVLP